MIQILQLNLQKHQILAGYLQDGAVLFVVAALETQKTATWSFTIINDLTVVANFAVDPNYKEF